MSIKKTLKMLISALISFLILNGVCFFFYNVPVHSESKTGSTDYIWEKSKFYSRGTEGFSWGKTDANGFNNLSADKGIEPEVLVMGTSHTEAFNVYQEESYVYRFDELMKQTDADMDAYNIGISGHRITTCMNNFEEAVKEFRPSEYVVMEVTTTELTLDEINQILDGSVKKNHSSANPIIVFLQKIPFLRRVYSQIDNLGVDLKNSGNVTDKNTQTAQEPVNNKSDNNESYEDALNRLLKKISGTAKENGVKLIIFHHSSLNIDENGNVIPREITEKSRVFESLCTENGIVYFDMYDSFSEYYNQNYRLPHGFSNTAVGEGHLNKYGHEVIANKLYELIMDLENHDSVEA